jgi:hypothetical protein
LRSFCKDLLILDLLNISFLLDVGVEEFEKKVFIINGFDPNLVIVAALVIV